MSEFVPTQNIDYLTLKDMVLEDYQRKTDPLQVKSIIEHFNEAKLGLLVTNITGGVTYLLDGGHRRAALMELGYSHALCVVLEHMTYKERAAYFAAQNEDNRRLNMFDLFRAKLKAGDKMCVEINNVVCRNGFSVGQSARNIRSVYELFNICKVYGLQTLDTALQLIRETWGEETLALKREFLIGVAEFVHRYGRAEFVAQMKRHDIYSVWRKFKEHYANAIGATTATMRKAFCYSLVQHYNRGIKRNSRRYLKMEEYCLENLA